MPRYYVEAQVTRKVWGYIEGDDEADAKSRAQCDDWDDVEGEDLTDVSVEQITEHRS